MNAGVQLRHWLRRLGAALYDGVLLLALWFVAVSAVVILAGKPVAPGSLWFELYLWGVSGLFCLWFWLHGGQTLGLRAWRLKVVDSASGDKPSWRQALVRFALAAPAWISVVGILWALADREQRALHERFSGTRLTLLPKT